MIGFLTRLGSSTAAAALAAAVAVGGAAAGTGLLVGAHDDGLKWNPASSADVQAARRLGLGAVRITLPWTPGEVAPTATDAANVRRALANAGDARLVVAAYGRAADAPQTDADRTAYCSYLTALVTAFPAIRDVVIWNEANSSAYWRPQFDPTGAGVAPAAYEALLARCWDALHAARPGIDVITSTAARGNDQPRATNADHSPGTWYRALAAAYRASGRTRRIFDTVGHNPYPDSSLEAPTATHPDSTTIGEGDYATLMQALAGFAGTSQPLPGQSGVSIWYLEDGYQSSVDPAKAALYGGAENARVVDAAQQAQDLADAVRLAYCQPAVGAFFNFQLEDETSLVGWQSGVLSADGTPKPAYQAFASAIADVRAGRVHCSGDAPASVPTGSSATPAGSPAAPAPSPAPAPAAPASAQPTPPAGGASAVVTLVIHPG